MLGREGGCQDRPGRSLLSVLSTAHGPSAVPSLPSGFFVIDLVWVSATDIVSDYPFSFAAIVSTVSPSAAHDRPSPSFTSYRSDFSSITFPSPMPNPLALASLLRLAKQTESRSSRTPGQKRPRRSSSTRRRRTQSSSGSRPRCVLTPFRGLLFLPFLCARLLGFRTGELDFRSGSDGWLGWSWRNRTTRNKRVL